VPGEVLNQVLPEVSQKARSTIWGTVRVGVKVHVDPMGNVARAELSSPGPSKFFADLALRAAKNWDFAPAKLDGHNVASDWIIRFQFTQSDTKVYPAEATP
jgi:TonB family protein